MLKDGKLFLKRILGLIIIMSWYEWRGIVCCIANECHEQTGHRRNRGSFLYVFTFTPDISKIIYEARRQYFPKRKSFTDSEPTSFTLASN